MESSAHLNLVITTGTNPGRQQAIQNYLSLYKGDVLNPNNFMELFCDLITNEFSSGITSSKQIHSFLRPAFVSLMEYLKNSVFQTERSNVIFSIENYLINN